MLGKQCVRLALLDGLTLLVLLAATVGPAPRVASAAASPSAPVPVAARVRSCSSLLNFDPARFSNPTAINNQWLPMVPGTQLILEGRSNVNGAALPHQVIFTVTGLSKTIAGVHSVVVWDRDLAGGTLTESELSFFAQDDSKNVWNLGEYPEEYKKGVFAGAPSTWIAGVAAAKPGIHMMGRPYAAARGYLQGQSLSIDFLDCARVYASGQHVDAPAGAFDKVLVTDEWSPLDPESGHQRKYHAAGVGIVQVGAVDDPEGETLVLIQSRRLSGQELAQANEQALKLDRRGRQTNAVYARTSAAVQQP